jgi:hypothetical protein
MTVGEANIIHLSSNCNYTLTAINNTLDDGYGILIITSEKTLRKTVSQSSELRA